MKAVSQIISPIISHSDLVAYILELAQALGYRCHYTYDSRKAPRGRHGQRRTNPGFPDLVLARDLRLIVIEVKIGDDTPTKDQQWWLDHLALLGLEVYLWTEHDIDRIEEILR